MLRVFFLSADRPTLALAWTGLAAYVLHAAFTAHISVLLNAWTTEFYDTCQTASPLLLEVAAARSFNSTNNERLAQAELALEHGVSKMWKMLLRFLFLVAPIVLLNPTFRYVRRRWTLLWRRCLVERLLGKLSDIASVEGVSQRVQEDTARFSSGVDDGLYLLVESAAKLIAFSPILYEIGGRVPATMVFGVRDPPTWWLLTLAYSTGNLAFCIAFTLSRRLVLLEVLNQKFEARFRKLLVLQESIPADAPLAVVEEVQPAASTAKSADEPTRSELVSAFDDVYQNVKNLYVRFGLIELGTGAYQQLVVLVPYMLIAPLLFQKGSGVTLGTLMQATHAFGTISDTLQRLADAIPALNEFRSVLLRLRRIWRDLLRDVPPGASLFELGATSSTERA